MVAELELTETEAVPEDNSPGASDAVSNEIARMLERIAPSVVEVRREGRGGGAGFVWRADGAVLTNYHVVAGRGGEISVHLPDGRNFPAYVTSENPALDLALLKVDATDLPAVLVDDSSKLRVGELVFAVGHPWGHRNVVTAGIVSGLGEVGMPGSEHKAQFVRSDVRVAPGNSGGPLLNAQGAVVGITAMIFGGDMTVAIPSKVAIDWVAGLPSRRVYLGVGIRPVELPLSTPQKGRQARAAGLLVVGLDNNGPAQRAGVLVGDVMLAAGGKPVVDGDTLLDVLAQVANNGDSNDLELHIMRGGSIRTLQVSLNSESDEGSGERAA